MPTKRIGLFLACIGLGGTFIMYLLPPKTTFITILALLLIFVCFVYPVWNFWWIEKILWRRLFSLFLLAILVCGLGYYVWPVKQEQIPQAKPPVTTEKEKEPVKNIPPHTVKRVTKTEDKPYFSISGILIKTNPTSPTSQIEIKIKNTGNHTAINLYHKFIIINNQFIGKPIIGETSSANEYFPNIPHLARVEIPLPEDVAPLYVVFAIKYQDKEVQSKKESPHYQIWYFKTDNEWIGAKKNVPPPRLVYATLEDKENIIKNLKPLLKDYQK